MDRWAAMAFVLEYALSQLIYMNNGLFKRVKYVNLEWFKTDGIFIFKYVNVYLCFVCASHLGERNL